MKSFKEYFSESFNRPYRFNLIPKKSRSHGDIVIGYDAEIRLPDKTNLHISIYAKGWWKVNPEFDPDVLGWEVNFTRDYDYGKTKQGDQMRIFATVIAAIREFIQKEKPSKILFTGLKSEEEKDSAELTSREKLYKKLVQEFAGPLGYKATVKSWAKGTLFTLTRK